MFDVHLPTFSFQNNQQINKYVTIKTIDYRSLGINIIA
jgi:hypothetical protein